MELLIWKRYARTVALAKKIQYVRDVRQSYWKIKNVKWNIYSVSIMIMLEIHTYSLASLWGIYLTQGIFSFINYWIDNLMQQTLLFVIHSSMLSYSYQSKVLIEGLCYVKSYLKYNDKNITWTWDMWEVCWCVRFLKFFL